jgi:hypothetical protein
VGANREAPSSRAETPCLFKASTPPAHLLHQLLSTLATALYAPSPSQVGTSPCSCRAATCLTRPCDWRPARQPMHCGPPRPSPLRRGSLLDGRAQFGAQLSPPPAASGRRQDFERGRISGARADPCGAFANADGRRAAPLPAIGWIHLRRRGGSHAAPRSVARPSAPSSGFREVGFGVQVGGCT